MDVIRFLGHGNQQNFINIVCFHDYHTNTPIPDTKKGTDNNKKNVENGKPSSVRVVQPLKKVVALLSRTEKKNSGLPKKLGVKCPASYILNRQAYCRGVINILT